MMDILVSMWPSLATIATCTGLAFLVSYLMFGRH